VLFFELFPIFITVVATTIVLALVVISRRRRNEPERPRERRDPTRTDDGTRARFSRPSMRG
jgi:hypothetical protein